MSSASRLASLCLLIAAALGSAACGPARSELVVTWTFAGQSCAQVGVTAVRVSIVGEALSPDTFACDAGNGNLTTGADLGSYLFGSYDVTLDGYDASGNLAYSAEQVLKVGSGSNRYAVDLAQQTQTTLTVKWTFDGGKTCAQAGNPTLHVTLDGSPVPQQLANGTETQDLPCAQQAAGGSLQDGISIYPIAAGAHSLSFTALVGGQAAYSLVAYTATAVQGQDVAVAPDLAAVASTSASASLRWTFAGGLSCADALVDRVRIDFADTGSAGEVPCTASGIDGAMVSGIAEGSHQVRIIAFRTISGTKTLVYESQYSPYTFYNGASTAVQLDAAADAPAHGGAVLTFAFPAGGPDCSSATATAVSYTLTSPAGVAQTAAQATCGGAAAQHTGLYFCSDSAGCVNGGLAPLSAGRWTLSASAQGYAASATFAVANLAQQQYTLTFH